MWNSMTETMSGWWDGIKTWAYTTIGQPIQEYFTVGDGEGFLESFGELIAGLGGMAILFYYLFYVVFDDSGH